ncbi:MAG: PQQ-dependent sugar dehydrogenase [Sphingosinicella sp.]|uniref:PQQ-dependent sugar dehydrogenase n=1 Tax=Sphingosinicella sp. TaxID=1917971 RepID=UPI004038072B
MNRGIPTLLALALLVACSSGGGGSGNPPPPAGNAPPAFTSAANVNVAENSTGTIYTATATDPDGNPLTFSLAGGADQARFAITAGGALSFTAPPDFEFPTDADGNNAYQVTLQVSDGTTSVTLALTVNVTNVGPDGFRVTRVATGFSQPLYLAPVPDGSGRVFVVERIGRIRILNPNTGTIAATPFLDIQGETTTDGERGLLGFTTAPDFAATGNFYVFLTNLQGNIEVRRYRTAAANRDLGNPATADVIISILHPGFANHNGGWLDFGPDGFLYLGTGDGGGAGDPNGNGQNRNSLLGKILRINVALDAFPADPLRDYAIPTSNPFAGGGGAPEIWAYGLRNPFRASFDPLTQNLWIGDVGQGAREEIDLMTPANGGANFGWNILEGTANFAGAPQPGLTPPVAEYSHGSGPREGRSVTGGVVYRGPVEALRGQYLFADFITGNLWSFPIARIALGATLPSDQFTLRNASFASNAGTIDTIAAFGVDQAGNVYIVDLGGEIFRIEPS